MVLEYRPDDACKMVLFTKQNLCLLFEMLNFKRKSQLCKKNKNVIYRKQNKMLCLVKAGRIINYLCLHLQIGFLGCTGISRTNDLKGIKMELNFMFLVGIGLVKVSSFNMNVVKENNHFQHLKKNELLYQCRNLIASALER